jgi:hypothetical protein
MRRALIFALIAAAVAAAGCGSDDGDDQSPDTPEERAVARAYSDYIDAVKQGDGEAACAHLTPAFQRRAGASIALGSRKKLEGAACPQAIEQGTLPQIQQVVPNLVRVEVSGDRASGFDPGEGLIGPQKVLFQKLGGEWRISRTIFFQPESGTTQGQADQ